MQSSTPKLYYFDMSGRAEAIRLAFTIGNIPFEDVRFSMEEFPKTYKSMSPNNQCPFMEIDGKIYAESSALLTYAGMRSGLVPTDPVEMMKMTQVTSYFGSKSFEVIRPMIVASKTGQDASQQAAEAHKALPSILATTDSMLAKKSRQEVDIGDLGLFCSMMFYMNDMSNWVPQFKFPSLDEIKSNYPNVYNSYNKVKTLPAVEKYYASRA